MSPPVKGGDIFIMRDRKRKKFFCVTGATPEDFEDNMNEILKRYFDPEVTYAPGVPMMAYILATEWDKVPETIADVYSLKGETYDCKDCPQFVRSSDMRRKYHWCSHKQQAVHIDNIACDEFYQWLDSKIIEKPERR